MKNKILILASSLFVVMLYSQQHVPNSNSGKGATPIIAVGDRSSSVNNTYAVVVGISDYQDPGIPDLRFADKDAQAFANYLRSIAGGSLDEDHLKVLINQQATLANFGNALDWLIDNVKENDRAIIYFSGHGDVEKKTMAQPGFLLCWDAPLRVYMAGGTFNLRDIQDIVSTLSVTKKSKVIIITDACHSGTLAGSAFAGSQVTTANLSKQFGNEIKILSCQPNEYSIEGEQWGGGRGAFSFHLVDAFFGLADHNNDQIVTLQEIGRYLEDHVTNEVAPISQIPMIIGNRAEQMTIVDTAVLTSIRSGKTNQMAMLTSIESRGIEEDVLNSLDTSIRKVYQLFKNALKDKVFFEPLNACANSYYEQLFKEPKLNRLHATIRRNYAAALQNEAQQAINIWLSAADPQQLEQLDNRSKLNHIPQQLFRAAELLGENHYMYRSLQARKLLFEGILLGLTSYNPDEKLARNCMTYLMKSIDLEPQSPLPWSYLSDVYAIKLRQADSAIICAREAHKLSPTWVLPFANLGWAFTRINNIEMAKQALMEADAIDSLHPYVIENWASWYSHQPGNDNEDKAVLLYEKYRDRGGPMYSYWHGSFGDALLRVGRYEESEAEYLKMDSTIAPYWISLGTLYLITGRLAEAEPYFIKANLMDSTNIYVCNNLGFLYLKTEKYTESERLLKKAISLDSTVINHTHNLGQLYIKTGRYEEAEVLLKKTILMDTTFANPRKHLAMVHFKTKRVEEARKGFLKAIELNPDYMPSYLGMAYIFALEEKTVEAFSNVEQAIQKGASQEQLEKDSDLDLLKKNLKQWKSLMNKYFIEKAKD